MLNKAILRTVSLGALSLLIVGNGLSQKAASSSPALLYRISGKKLKRPSYIFGTIHLICPNDMFPADSLKSYIAQTEQLMLEIDLDDPAVMQAVAKGSVLPDGRSVKEYLKLEEYAKIDAVFKDYLGVSYDRLQTIRPNLVSSILMRSPKVIGCAGPVAYDNFLVETAKADKLPVSGLESVEAEFAALDAQPIERQVEGLTKMASDPEKGLGEFKELYKVYLTQSSDDLYKLTVKAVGTEAALQSKLLTERNAAWMPIIEKNIAAKPTFIGVGGAHLGGSTGLLRLLKARGYKLTPIRL